MSEKREGALGVDDAVLDVIRDQKPRRTLLHRGTPSEEELETLDPQTRQEIADDNFYAVSQKTGKIVRLGPGERARGHGLLNDSELPPQLRRNIKIAGIIAQRKAK